MKINKTHRWGPDEKRLSYGCSVSFQGQGNGIDGLLLGWDVTRSNVFILQRSPGYSVETGEDGGRDLGLGGR